MSSITKEQLLKQAEANGIEISPDATRSQILEALKNGITPAPALAKSEGQTIAEAIVQGLAASKDEKKIKIVSDKSVNHMFSVVRSKSGEVMLRENSTGVLSKVQLESLEEKEASIQGQEVEEV